MRQLVQNCIYKHHIYKKCIFCIPNSPAPPGSKGTSNPNFTCFLSKSKHVTLFDRYGLFMPVFAIPSKTGNQREIPEICAAVPRARPIQAAGMQQKSLGRETLFHPPRPGAARPFVRQSKTEKRLSRRPYKKAPAGRAGASGAEKYYD